MPTRRAFLQTVSGAAAVTVAGLATAAHRDGDWAAKPAGVTIEYDQTFLQQYQPKLVLDYQTREKVKGLYGYVVRGDAYQYDVACYWLQATHQEGLTTFGVVFGPDSHLGDHEPVYVLVDDDAVDRVIYSTYHHFAGAVTPETATFVQDRASDETHVVLRTVPEWHNYTADTDRDGAFLTLEDWLGVRDSWVDNGFYDETAPAAVENPDTMRSRDSWWRTNTLDYPVGKALAWAGLRGADQADPIKD